MATRTSRRVMLKFPRHLVNWPVLSDAVRRYDLEFNILKAYVSPREEGFLALELSGGDGSVDAALESFEIIGVLVTPLERVITRDEVRCTHCGACIAICPTDALSVDPETAKITFDTKHCIACGHCLGACPPRAMEEHIP